MVVVIPIDGFICFKLSGVPVDTKTLLTRISAIELLKPEQIRVYSTSSNKLNNLILDKKEEIKQQSRTIIFNIETALGLHKSKKISTAYLLYICSSNDKLIKMLVDELEELEKYQMMNMSVFTKYIAAKACSDAVNAHLYISETYNGQKRIEERKKLNHENDKNIIKYFENVAKVIVLNREKNKITNKEKLLKLERDISDYESDRLIRREEEKKYNRFIEQCEQSEKTVMSEYNNKCMNYKSIRSLSFDSINVSNIILQSDLNNADKFEINRLQELSVVALRYAYTAYLYAQRQHEELLLL